MPFKARGSGNYASLCSSWVMADCLSEYPHDDTANH